MPQKNHASVLRRMRRSERTTKRNRNNAARVRSALRSIRTVIASKDAAESNKLLIPTISLIDHSVSLKALHRNAAARLKSRLTRQVASLSR